MKDKEMLAILEGMHHGFKPNASPILETADVYGGEQWSKERFDLLKILQNEFSFDASDVLEDWKKTSVLGGFITVADWIASGSMFGTLGKNHSKTEKELRNMAKEAVHNAGFETLSVKKGLSYLIGAFFEPGENSTVGKATFFCEFCEFCCENG